VRTTISIDDDVLELARQLAVSQQRSVGAVISDLARRSLRPTTIRIGGGFPVFDVPSDAARITAKDVAAVLDDD